MKKQKFSLESILDLRNFLEREQATKFGSALSEQMKIESNLTSHRHNLLKMRQKRDMLLMSRNIDIKRLKTIQEEILFGEVDENVLERKLVSAMENSEKERRAWIIRKSEKDALKKLKEKHIEAADKEMLGEEQKEIDEIAGRNFMESRKIEEK
jgi:flagellar export protein FliJ